MLNPSISHSLAAVDPGLDTRRDEGEERLALLRPLLRLFARSVDSAALVDRESDGSFGALLAGRRSAALGGPLLDGLLKAGAARPRACLVSPTVKLIDTLEADRLSEDERVRCIAITGEPKLAVRGEAAQTASVIVTFDKGVAGGARDGRLEVQLVSATSVKVSTVSASGQRKIMGSGEIPAVVVARAFEPAPVSALPPAPRQNELPEYLKLGLVDFLERKVRLQVLCTAAMPAPASRPVVLDRAYLRPLNKSYAQQLAIRATLHPSSSSCVCAAHGLRFDSPGEVEITLGTCGRSLQQASGGRLCCPLHQDAANAQGEARFAIDKYCTEKTEVAVTCIHRNNQGVSKGVQVNSVPLTDADRAELGTLLVAMEEFEARTAPFSKKGAVDVAEIARLERLLAAKLAKRLEAVERQQLCRECPETQNPRALLQRDMAAVDLLRGGGVFRHSVRSGPNAGRLYLKRRAEQQPLKPHEAALAETHVHLFRKAP